MVRLSKKQLFEITKYKHKSKQAEWLRERGIPFQLDRFDQPVVFEEHITGGQPKKQMKATTTKWEPPPLN